MILISCCFQGTPEYLFNLYCEWLTVWVSDFLASQKWKVFLLFFSARFLLSKVGFPLVDIFRTEPLFLRRNFLIMENIKKTPQIKLETIVQRCSVNKVFLEISQNLRENTCALGYATLLKKRLWHRCFPVILVKFTRASFFIEHLCWLLL